MNKDVIYIEPEDDITDIIGKIENSKEKIVALVPPKKAGVLRSVVNIKLISKAAAGAKKTAVLVTTDPSIMKLAGTVQLPVTKDLQSAPSIPEAEVLEEEEVVKEEVSEDGDEVKEEVKEEVEVEEEKEDEEEKKEEEEKAEDEAKEEAKDKKEKTKKTGLKKDNKFIQFVKEHNILFAAGAILFVLFILLMIWALVIAPAVTITAEIKTTQENFSEAITFTTELEKESVEEGRLYLGEKKIETPSEVEFEATGTKNVGNKASGDVVIYAFFDAKGTIAINAGSTFTVNGLSFTSDENATLSWDGKTSTCENQDDEVVNGHFQCLKSGRISVTAAGAGAGYNIPATPSGWTTTANVRVYSDKEMTGGSDAIIKVVQQSDIDKAKDELSSTSEEQDKEKLLDEIGEGMMVINSSFTRTTSDAVSTPAVGEEVKEGQKAILKATTTAKINYLDETKVEEFIREKAKIADSSKIYEIKSPFVENFMKTDEGYTGKLKTSYAVGPKITENDVVDIVRGKGLGEANHDLKDINGIVEVKITTSYPWVMSVPNDANKITVFLEVKE